MITQPKQLHYRRSVGQRKVIIFKMIKTNIYSLQMAVDSILKEFYETLTE